MKKVIIIGTNHAGTAAINTIVDNSDEWEVTTYDSNNNISFLGCGIALWMAGKIKNPQDLFYSSPEILKSKGVSVNMEHKVTNIDYDKKEITVENLKTGDVFTDKYDKLIHSVGSWPVSPTFKDTKCEDWDNAVNIKLYQHGQQLMKSFEDDSIKKISIIGAGYIGVELAEAARDHGKEVTLIDFSPRIMERYYDAEFTGKMEKVLTDNGVKLELGQKVEEIIGENKILTSIKTNNKEIETDLAIFCIGAMPNTKWLVNDKLKMIPNGAIIVNDQQLTSIDDVYAIGDCATVHNNVSNKDVSIALASNAVKSGRVAGYNVIGMSDNHFTGVEGANAISIYGLNMISTGLTKKAAEAEGFKTEIAYLESEQKLGFMEDVHEVMVKVVYDIDTRLILGAQLASTYDISMGIHFYSLAIAKKTKIDELKFFDTFFLPHFNSPFNYINDVAIKAK